MVDPRSPPHGRANGGLNAALAERTAETAIASPPLNGLAAMHGEQDAAMYSEERRGSQSNASSTTNGWSERRYQDDEDDSYSVHDEEAPIQYPPISEEDKEARKVEQKLEQWAAEEKMRRKAKRSSRTASVLVPPASSSRLARRLSSLGSISSAKTQAIPSTPAPATKHSSGPRSADPGPPNGRTVNGTAKSWRMRDASLQDVPELSGSSSSDSGSLSESIDASSSSMTSAKGKGKLREASDPFQDPTPQHPSTIRPTKPTPHSPIVTPGRAPTIRHRALQQDDSYRTNLEGAARQQQPMPAIVATDADEEREAQAALDQFQQLEDDPFQSVNERRAVAAEDATTTPKRYAMAKSNSSYTIGSSVDDSATRGGLEAPKRKSTNSRFNEIGLDDDQDATGWPDDDEARSSPAGDATPRQRPYDYEAQSRRRTVLDDGSTPRAPWWSEWLCGCGTPTEADLEQSGRTFPE